MSTDHDTIVYCRCIGGSMSYFDPILGVRCIKCGHDIKGAPVRQINKEYEIYEELVKMGAYR